MQINFHPNVGQKITVSPPLLASHISTYATRRKAPAVVKQSIWQEHDFIEDINKTSHAEDLTTGGRRLSLCLSVNLHPDVSEVEFSYTYRISYPDGRLKWFGKYGQNGICLVNRQDSHILLGDQWCGKDGTTYNLESDGSSESLLTVLRGLDPNSYHLHAFDLEGSGSAVPAVIAHSITNGLSAEIVLSNCSLLFIVPKHTPDPHVLSQAFVISSSLRNSVSLSANGDVSIKDNAKNSLLCQVYSPQTDLHSIVEAAVSHSMPDKMRALSVDRQNSLVVLATSALQYPMRLIAIGLSPATNVRTTEADLEQRDLENLFTSSANRICIYPPFTTGTDSMLQDGTAKRVSLDIGTRYTLSPEYHLRFQGGHRRISVLSDHTNVRVPVEQPNTRILPTPPPSPQVPWPPASKQNTNSTTRTVQPAKGIRKAIATYVRYWFFMMFFLMAISWHIISILTRMSRNNAKKSSKSKKDESQPQQTTTSEGHTCGPLHDRSLSMQVLPGELIILLLPEDDVAAENPALRIKLDGEELGGFIEWKVDGAVLLTTMVGKEGEIEISVV